MNLEPRVLGTDRIEFGLGSGLYVSCERDARTGAIRIGTLQSEAGGERADQLAQRMKIPSDYSKQIREAAERHFSTQYAHAAE